LANNSKKKDFSREIDSSKIQDFSNKFVHFLEKEYGLGKDEIKGIMSKAEKKSAKEIRIPVSIFDNEELSILETICKYLKEELMLNFHKIALSLNRNDRTIWATYNNSLKKRKEKLVVGKSEISIPLSLLKNRKFTAYELIVLHLKDSCKLNYHQMGILLRRDERNIWTTYQKARKKNVK
jgi:predicted DNA-binding protein (UPF0251 family)